MANPCIVIYKGKSYTKEEFMDQLMKGELDQYLGKQFEKPLTPQADAIQKQGAAESMLRQERSELGLQEMVQGDQGKEPAGKVTPQAEVSPIEAKKQQLRKEIDDLTQEVYRKSALSSGGQFQTLPQVVEIVGKYAQLGMVNIESIAKDLIEKGYSRLLPKLKEAYNAYIRTEEAKALGFDPVADKIKDFDHQALINQAIKEAKAEAKMTLEKSVDYLKTELFPEEPGKKPVITQGRYGVGTRRAGLAKSVIQAPFVILDKVQEATVGKLVDNISNSMKKSFEQRLMNPDNKGAKAIVLDMVNTLFRPISEERYGERGEKLYGQMETGKLYASSILHKLHDLYGMNKESIEKVHKVLDPDFYRVKSQKEFEAELASSIGQDAYELMKEQDQAYLDQAYMDYRVATEAKGGEKIPTIDDLADNEKQYYETIRAAGDAIHSANMLSGLMGLDTYTVNKSKYIPRMYEAIEKKQEIARMEGERKQALDIFKTREEIDEWKMTNRITDPSYLMAKRMQQAYRNKAIADYAQWVSSKYGTKIFDAATVKEAPANYVKLGKGYGVLSDKYVPLSIAEDFKGFMFTNDYAQKAYNILKAYDQSKPRTFYKKLFTQWNPSTQISNIISNVQFAAWMNIDPVSYNINMKWANGERKAAGSDYQYLLSKGLLKNSMTREDYVEALNKFESEIDNVVASKNPLRSMTSAIKSGAKWASDMYEIADDNAKMAAWRTLVEMGVSSEDAISRVSKGFQNYTRLPKAFDLAARTPGLASPFSRFKADLARIVINNASRRPLTTFGYLYMLNSVANMMSAYSGESEDERKVRESRKGTPKIPFADIPLTWKIGGAELNIARYLAPYYTFETYDGSDFNAAMNKVLPYDYTQVPEDSKHPDGPWASWFGVINKDPITQVLNLAWDADFQGRPISDPYATNYKEGTASSKTKAYNTARYLTSAYLPFGRQGLDLYDAILMQSNPALKEQYTKQGRQILTPGQAFARTFGVKLQQITDQKYKQMLESQVNKLAYDFEKESQKLNTIRKNLQENKISEDEAMSAMNETLENLLEMTNKIGEFQGSFTSDQYKEMQEEYFNDYDGYNTAVERYNQAKEATKEFMETPVQKGGGRRRSSGGLGGFGSSGLTGF